MQAENVRARAAYVCVYVRVRACVCVGTGATDARAQERPARLSVP